MRIYQGYTDYLSVSHLRQTMLKNYLSLWEEKPYWRVKPSGLSTKDAMAWASVLRASDEAYTISHQSWLNEHEANPPWPRTRLPINASEHRKEYLTIGPRLYWSEHGDKKWFLRIEPNRYKGSREELLELCRQHFVAVFEHVGKIYLSVKKTSSFHDDAVVLIKMLESDSPEDIFSLWRRACALNCEIAFGEMLPTWQRDNLNNILKTELESGQSHLGLEEDVRGELFMVLNGRADISKEKEDLLKSRHRMSGRLGDLLHANDVLNLHFPICASSTIERDYYSVVARAAILSMSAAEVAGLFSKLPAGRTMLHCMNSLARYRPQLLAEIVSYSGTCAEGILGILNIPTIKHLTNDNASLTYLTEERAEIQKILRWHIIGTHYPYHVTEAVTLGFHDEMLHGNKIGQSLNKAELDWQFNESIEARLAPWEAALKLDPGPVNELLDTVVTHLVSNRPVVITDITFAIRILKLLNRYEEQKKLLTAIVDAYIQFLDLTDYCSSKLVQFIEPIAELASMLRLSSMQELWEKWLSLSDVLTSQLFKSTDEKDIKARLSLQDKLSAHLMVLLSQMKKLGNKGKERVIAQIFRIYETEKKQGVRWGLFCWSGNAAKSDGAIEPLLVQFGQYLSTLNESCTSILERLLALHPNALEQAQILWGAKQGEIDCLNTVRHNLHKIVQKELRDGQAVGYIWELLISLFKADAYNETLICADEFHKVMQKHKGNNLEGTYGGGVLYYKLASLIFLKKYSEAVSLKISDYGGNLSLQCNLYNLMAIACLNVGSYDIAQQNLDAALRLNPADLMALSNYTALFLWRREWDKVVEASIKAREVLGQQTPSEVLQNEILARYELGDREGSARLLEQLPKEAGNNLEMLQIRTAMLLSAVASRTDVEDYIKILEKTNPKVALETRAQIASAALVNSFKLSTLAGLNRARESLEATLGEKPEIFISQRLAQNCLILVERPDLALDLDEDQLTMILAFLMKSLIGVGLQMKLHPDGGHGKTKVGVADFAIDEVVIDPTANPRRIVTGEAKIWDGIKYVEDGIRQLLGTSNTYREHFISLIIYVKDVDFSGCVLPVRDCLNGFSCDYNGHAFYKCVECIEIDEYKGSAVRVYRSVHKVYEADREPYRDRVLYTYLVDLRTDKAKAARRTKGGSKAKAKK